MSTAAPPEPGWQAEWPTEPAGPPPPKRSPLSLLKELPALVVLFIAGAFLMKTFLIQLFWIPSESMEPTLMIDDRVVVNKLAFRFREPRRGEVVVFVAERSTVQKALPIRVFHSFLEGLGVRQPDERDFIKRVIGLPGDTIRVTESAVYITPPGGKRTKLVEPYAHVPGGRNGSLQPAFTVPQDTYFVMGDNRNNSSDSRTSLGPIRRSDLIGKAFVRIFPGAVEGQSLFERLGRIGLITEGEYPPPLGDSTGAVASGLLAVSAWRVRASRPLLRPNCSRRALASSDL